MRPIIVVALLGLYCGLVYGQGSGDVVVITPTSNSGFSTDGTNDSGSGDDDEDGGASGDKPTVRPSSGTPTVGDDEDEDDGSGSGSGGSGFIAPTTGTVVTPSKSTGTTDIYISEGTTEATTKKPTTEATTKATTEATTEAKTNATTEESIVVKNVIVDTTPNVATSVQTQTPSTEAKTTIKRPTTPVMTKKEIQTTPVTTKKERERPTTPKESTTYVTTKKESKRPTTPKESTPYPVTEESSTKFVKEMNPTTKATDEPETTLSPNIMAREGDDPNEEGFTLTTEVIIGVVACALLALLLIAFLMYRLKKRDEGSYLLDDTCGNPIAYKKGFADKEAFV